MLLHLFNTVPWHIRQMMLSINSATQGLKFRPMSLMVKYIYLFKTIDLCLVHHSHAIYDLLLNCSVIRAGIPKLNLDDAFEQKNEIAKAVEEELEKVMYIIAQRCLLNCKLIPFIVKVMGNYSCYAVLFFLTGYVCLWL